MWIGFCSIGNFQEISTRARTRNSSSGLDILSLSRIGWVRRKGISAHTNQLGRPGWGIIQCRHTVFGGALLLHVRIFIDWVEAASMGN